MSGTADTADRPLLSLDQQRESLWSDALQQVYAVILGNRVPDLRARLEQADVGDWDLIWSGELEPGEAELAPHLVQLRLDSPFSNWLTAEAAAGFGAWGVFLRTRLPFLPVRTHCRALCQARLPDGQELRLDWADPLILTTLLPLAPAMQLARIFKDLDSIVIAGRDEWTLLSCPLGRLQMRVSGVLGAG